MKERKKQLRDGDPPADGQMGRGGGETFKAEIIKKKERELR